MSKFCAQNEDCYLKALPDEPTFTLLGRDPDAPATVRRWAELRKSTEGITPKVLGAYQIAEDMERWAEANPHPGTPPIPLPAADQDTPL